jgi:hypothetical protein
MGKPLPWGNRHPPGGTMPSSPPQSTQDAADAVRTSTSDADVDRPGAAAPPLAIAEEMRRAGISRRTLLAWSAGMAGLLALPRRRYGPKIAAAMETQSRLPVLWLHGQSCDGNIESRCARPSPPVGTDLDQFSSTSPSCSRPLRPAATTQLATTISGLAGSYVGRRGLGPRRRQPLLLRRPVVPPDPHRSCRRLLAVIAAGPARRRRPPAATAESARPVSRRPWPVPAPRRC